MTMQNEPEIADATSARAIVAAKVRGLLAEQRISINSLPGRLGRESSRYWYRRLTELETALDVDDLADLARLLGVDIVELFGAPPRNPRGPGGGPRRRHTPLPYVDDLARVLPFESALSDATFRRRDAA